MFGLGPATKIYIAIEGVDMRKGFDGLFGLVRDRLGQDPLSGHLFQCPFDCTSAKPRLPASADYPSLSSPASQTV